MKRRCKVKVKVKVKAKSTLEQATKAQSGNRCIALLYLLGARWGSLVSATPWPLYPGTHPVLIEEDPGVGPGAGLKGAENLSPTGIRSADRPARSESTTIARHTKCQCMGMGIRDT
jgi:hypothetical protein